jgi:hypothetical protein
VNNTKEQGYDKTKELLRYSCLSDSGIGYVVPKVPDILNLAEDIPM